MVNTVGCGKRVAAMPVISVEDVSKKYNVYERPLDRLKEIVFGNRLCFHREFWALQNISFSVDRSNIVALIGPNGSGKSTLLQLLAGVIQPTYGQIRKFGRITAILELGAGFQPEFTGRENVLMNGLILGISESDLRSKLDQIADFADIGDFFDQPIKTYSSGMVVRLAFSAAVAVDPTILLVDEALAVGDVQFQQKCIQKLEDLRGQGVTIVFVSHDMNVVRDFCTSAVLLNGGKIVMQGNVPDVIAGYHRLFESPEHIASKEFTVPKNQF